MKQKILQLRQALATRLNRSCREWSSARIVVIFGCVLLLTMIASTAVIHNAIFNDTGPVMRINPVVVKPLLPDRHIPVTIVTDSLYHRLQSFRLYLDSIPATVRDSLLAERPGMPDSIRLLESLYYKQKRIQQ